MTWLIFLCAFKQLLALHSKIFLSFVSNHLGVVKRIYTLLPIWRLTSIKNFNSFLFNRIANLRILLLISHSHQLKFLYLLQIFVFMQVASGRMLKLKEYNINNLRYAPHMNEIYCLDDHLHLVNHLKFDYKADLGSYWIVL